MNELPLGETNRPTWIEKANTIPHVEGWLAGRLRAVLDRVTAFVLLIIAIPIIAVAAILVKLTSRGPAFYVQSRVGCRGQLFSIYKLRTMTHNCESLSGVCWSKPGDVRITWFGRFLRASHIDELPQLWNALRGEMSLVGPRPERPELLEYLTTNVEGYVERLAVRPGITGLAQLWLPADTDLDSVRQKLRQDVYYIRIARPWTDAVLILCTPLKVLGTGFSQSICRLLGVGPLMAVVPVNPVEGVTTVNSDVISESSWEFEFGSSIQELA